MGDLIRMRRRPTARRFLDIDGLEDRRLLSVASIVGAASSVDRPATEVGVPSTELSRATSQPVPKSTSGDPASGASMAETGSSGDGKSALAVTSAPVSGASVVKGTSPGSAAAPPAPAGAALATLADDEDAASAAIASGLIASGSGEDMNSAIVQGIAAAQGSGGDLAGSTTEPGAGSSVATITITAAASSVSLRLDPADRGVVVDTGVSSSPGPSLDRPGLANDPSPASGAVALVDVEQAQPGETPEQDLAASEATSVETDATRGADLLAIGSRFECRALEQSIDELFGSSGLVASDWGVWEGRATKTMTIVLAGVAAEALRRRIRDQRFIAPACVQAGSGPGDDDASYFPGMPGLPPRWGVDHR